MKPDKNYISIHGDNTGNIYMGDKLLFAAGDYSKPRSVEIDEIIPPDGTYADSLKLSGVVDLTVNVGKIVGSREDVVDINHCKNVQVLIGEVYVKGKYLATIKGGSDGIYVQIAEQNSHGSEVDFDLGNWSDQSMERTKNVEIESRQFFEWSPVTIRVLHAWRPKLLGGGPYRVNTFMKGWFGFAYGLLKKVLRVVGGGQ